MAPPVWVIAASLVVPMMLIFGGYLIERSIRQASAAPFAEGNFQFVTPTPQPVAIAPIPIESWLSATAPVVPTDRPGFIQQLLPQPLFVSATPGFSIASGYIAYTCYINGIDQICLMHADGTGIKQLTDFKETSWYPSFSHDGTEILFSSQKDGYFNIYVMDLNGENLRQITYEKKEDCYAPSMSPDGTRVVFASTKGGAQNIWSIGVDGSGMTQLTRDFRDNIDPTYSPDGRFISYTSTHRGNGDLIIMNADGSNPRRVTNGINVEGRNTWSPDGKYLSFYAGPLGDKDIYIVESACADLANGCNTSQMRKLTAGGNNKGPDWSPDGQWVAFASQLEGRNEVFIMRIDGSEIHQLTFNNYADWQPRWGWVP
jgi:Tol biopolymer transport system component